MAFETPGLDNKFRLPRGAGDQALLTGGRAFLAAAAPLAAEFIKHEMPADFLDELKNHIIEFEATLNQRSTAKGVQASAKAGIEDAIERGTVAVRRLDAIVRNKFRSHVGVMAAWMRASHVERTSRPATANHSKPPEAPKQPETPEAPKRYEQCQRRSRTRHGVINCSFGTEGFSKGNASKMGVFQTVPIAQGDQTIKAALAAIVNRAKANHLAPAAWSLAELGLDDADVDWLHGWALWARRRSEDGCCRASATRAMESPADRFSAAAARQQEKGKSVKVQGATGS